MDYEKSILYFDRAMENEAIDIAIYADKEYINNTINMIDRNNESRITS